MNNYSRYYYVNKYLYCNNAHSSLSEFCQIFDIYNLIVTIYDNDKIILKKILTLNSG